MKKGFRYAFIFIMAFMIFYQAKETYKWQYINDIRYQKEKSDMTILAHELLAEYDVKNKPVVFWGYYPFPKIIVDKAIIKTDSFHYKVLEAYCNKFFKENLPSIKYYNLVQSSACSYIQWATDTFYPEEYANKELIKFFNYLGYDFKPGTIEMLEEAKLMMENEDIPAWPKEGSIVDTEEYIFVRF